MAQTNDPESLPREAKNEEIRTLVHEPDEIPIIAWLLAFTGAAAQLARFGVTVTWRKFMVSSYRKNPFNEI